MTNPKAQLDPDSLFVYLEKRRLLVEKALRRCVPSASTPPETIHQAMRYSLLAGGKRLRPILVLAAAEAIGGSDEAVIQNAFPAACAIELLHTCSLIHDDLPCMDDDDMRRRRPAAHRVFGEAIALLAGDALLARAFGVLATVQTTERHSLAVFMSEMATSVGSLRLIGGQVADVEAGGKTSTLEAVRFIHERKTAEMVVLGLRLGAMTADASPKELKALSDFGYSLGVAYQIIDDVLDLTQSSQKLGKTAGKDTQSAKATYPAVIGIEESRKEAARLTEKARAALKILGPKAHRLAQLTERLLGRDC